MPFLNQQKGKNDHIKYFMINLHERMLPDLAGIHLQPPSRTRIQLCYRVRHENMCNGTSVVGAVLEKVLFFFPNDCAGV